MIDHSLQVAMEESKPLMGNEDIPILSDKVMVRLTNPVLSSVNLNTASMEELMMLPGVGVDTANRIINARPYTTLEELLEVRGIGPARFNEIKNLVTVGPKDPI